MALIGIHCLISGKVQGVFYRAHASQAARSLKLTGWVRNLPDGRVELKAFGEAKSLGNLKVMLIQGPAAAEIEELSVEELPFEKWEDFSVK